MDKQDMDNKAYRLEMAEQQIFGFISAKDGETIQGLAEGMGLTKNEWLTLKNNGTFNSNKELINDLNNFFEVIKNE